MSEPGNLLGGETSPYLKQHADQPVHWQPWGEPAIAAARARDVPILLSIGYSSCHWCHVMAHESFADPGTADVINAGFVAIKVDREERPDLDRVYQLAHQILTRSGGGWPLTAFLDPHTLLPFFSGTYFPKMPRFQLPAFTELLNGITQAWADTRDRIGEQAGQLRAILAQLQPGAAPRDALPGADLLKAARDGLAAGHDSLWGGFTPAPKFPLPTLIERMLRHWHFGARRGERDGEARDMAIRTLTRMARGGIHDHVGGGFFRYSTDEKWMIPHFEKMLYDNGPLLALFADGLTLGPDPLFEGAARGIARWLLDEMQHPDGGFHAALDADSEGEEGRFYTWRRNDIRRLVDADEYLLLETLYGLDKPANFGSQWNLHRTDAWRSVVERLMLEPEVADARLASALARLAAARAQRTRPARDDKVLAAWNGAAIGGLARAGVVLREPAWIDAACAAADFIRERMWHGGRLHATWMDGVARHPGCLDDYAQVLAGLLQLLQARWRDQDLRFAIALADALLEHFEDRDAGGFFHTTHDHEALIHRPKPTLDDALPSGNGTAARALTLLGHLMAEPRWIDAAHRALVWAGQVASQYPAGHAMLLAALEDHLYPADLVVVRGPAAEAHAWLDACRRGYQPHRWLFAIPTDTPPRAGIPQRLPPWLPRMMSVGDAGGCTAWVCRQLACSLPLRDVAALQKELG